MAVDFVFRIVTLKFRSRGCQMIPYFTSVRVANKIDYIMNTYGVSNISKLDSNQARSVRPLILIKISRGVEIRGNSEIIQMRSSLEGLKYSCL